jgi:hypothetical protein
MSQPLIVTLQIDQAAQAFYEDLRRRYFPAERNQIPAHLSLFHQLPDEALTHQALQQLAKSASAFNITNATPRSIGRGVAIFFDSQPLIELHATLSTAFASHLISQDRQSIRPHIVIQNKVDTTTAQHTLAQLHLTQFINAHATGITVWRYLNGPWEHLADLPFNAVPS